MKYHITVRVAAEEKVIDIPWEDIEKDYLQFILTKADFRVHKSLKSSLRLVTSRIKNVFLDRCTKSLIQ